MFQDQLGTEFALVSKTGSWTRVRLVEVSRTKYPEGPVGRREPFSLLFQGTGNESQSQAVYFVEHPRMGRMEFLLVPVYLQKEHCLEAVFG